MPCCLRPNLTAADSFSYRVWADDSPAHFPLDGPQGASATPHPTGLPNGFNPGFFAPSTLVSLSSGPISTGDAWLPAGATQTSGNNVKAYADLARPAGFGTGDLMGSVSTPGAFDWAFDPQVEPNANSTQRQAAITQLFYSNNFFHDWYYDVGFDEQAGNAQTSNLGRGGVDRDTLLAEAQDYSGRNNANMSTPSDGVSPRMQMYVFDGESTQTLTVSGSPAMTFAAGSASFGPQTYRVEGELVVAQNGALTNGCTAITNTVAGKTAHI